MPGDRMVVVRLLGEVGQFRAAMAEAAAAARGVEAAVTATNARILTSTGRMATAQRGAISSMGSGFRTMRSMMVGMGLPLAIGVAAKAFFDFEQQMARVNSVADGTKSGMHALKEAALTTGQAYGFSAVEVGKAEEALLKAGRTTSQVIGGELNSALTLAAAGSISLDESTKILATTMTIFGKEGLTTAHITDRLTQAANATVTGVSEMGAAMSYVGPVAAALGVSFDDTVGSIAQLAQAGIDGERAGTGLRGMLTNLLSPSAMAKTQMKELGIELFDNEGNFKGMAGAAEELNRALFRSNLSVKEQADAIGRLTTNASMPAFITLATGGEQGVRDIQTLLDAQENAAAVAKKRTDSAAGDLKKLAGAMNEAFVRTGEMALPVLRGITQEITSATQAFSHMGGAAQVGMLALAGYMAFGRQRMPRIAQGFQGGAMNFGLARAEQQNINALRARATAAEGAAGAAIPGSRMANSQLLVARGLREQASAAEAAAKGYGGLSGATGRWMANMAAAPNLGAKTTVAFRGLGSAIKGAGTGLMGAMGGPWGLAITGLLAGFTIWQSHQNDIQRRAEESKARIEANAATIADFGRQYALSGKLGSDATRQMLESNEPFRKLADSSARFGLSLDTIAKATIGDKRAQDDVIGSYDKRLKVMRDINGEIEGSDFDKSSEWARAISGGHAPELSAEQITKAKRAGLFREESGGFFDSKSATENTVRAVEASIAVSKEERKSWDKAFKDTANVQAVMQRMHERDVAKAAEKFGIKLEGASEGVKALTENLSALDSQDAKFTDRIAAMSANIQTLAGSLTAVSSGMAGFYAAAKGDLPDAFKDAKGGKIKPKLDPVTGGFDLTDLQGIGQFEVVNKMAKSAADTAESVFATAMASGATVETAGLAATATFGKLRDAAAGFLTDMGLKGPQLKGVLDNMFPTMEKFAQGVGATGAGQIVADLKSVKAELISLPTGQVKIVSNSEAEAKKLSTFGGTLSKIPGTKKFQIIFDSPQSLQDAIDKFEAIKHPKPIEVPVIYRPLAGGGSGPAGGLPKLKPQLADIDVRFGSADAAEHQLADLQTKSEITATLDPGNVESGLKALTSPRTVPVSPFLSGGLPALPPMHVTVIPHMAAGSLPSSGPPGLGNRWGRLHSFAVGGTTQAHVARGDLIRYAEPETGGEAFIPRRGDAQRSRSILETAASWYGLGIHKMAAGGLTSFALGGVSSGTAPMGDFLSRYMGVPDTWSTQRTAAMIDQRDAALAVKQAYLDLREVQKDAKHTSLQLAQAQNALADARRNLATSNVQLAKANLPARDQFKSSLDMGVKNTATFIRNLNILSSKGYGDLAMQLLQMGGPEAEAIAAGAIKWSSATASRVNAQARTAADQQKTLENMPAMLAIRNAVAKGESYGTLLGAGQFTGQEINSAIGMMQGELSKTPAGRALLASLHGNTAAALGAQIRGFAMGGIAPPGTMFRFAEPQSGGEAVIPRFGNNALPTLARAAAWHGLTVGDAGPGSRRSQPARPVQVVITVRGEGALASMIETRVDGALVQAAQAVTRGRSVR